MEIDAARSKHDLERAVKIMETMLGHVGHAAESGDRRADLVLDYLGLQYHIACNMQMCKILLAVQH